ncbi:E3 ubiquitin-protein ligase ARIH1-like [Gigantopelta aegis]|uniref:E3 ubiquitin-protein ligase ARIH1-like n=1 Tax=Gigantopelta aegis TaxID=1735272 RepID=UPI001B88CD7C|nr:E3 ubiquitin-protein ligase ARIH1-like [Gigantopelta aegis]
MSDQLSNIFNVFVTGIEGKTRTLQIHKDASIDELMNKISKINGIPVKDQRILYTRFQLEYGCDKYLSDYKMQNNSTVYVVLRLLGGSDIEGSTWTKKLDEDVTLTDAPDMITWDDDPNSQRAKMPCGHAIGPESLTAYCRSLLDVGKFEFICPYIGNDGYCGKEWPYFIVRRLAVLTERETITFETKICENYMRKACGIQDCPKCHSLCERVKSTDRRIVCSLCSKNGPRYEFCWSCLHPWTGRAMNDCGNIECTGEDPRLKILRDAPKKCIIGVANCPSRRACPSCGMVIEHIRACKHMKCPCGQRFCFICLKKAVDGGYPCGSYNTPCSVAAVQEAIPGC